MDILREIQNGLSKAFSQLTFWILEETMQIPSRVYNTKRKQFYSSEILARINSFGKKYGIEHILGVTDVDLFVPHLNFVFGEAEYSGRTAIISLFRLRPEFYGQDSNSNLFVERSVKEAVHEVGHMLGLGHCDNLTCVMFFSNSISDIDKKGVLLCEKCRLLVAS